MADSKIIASPQGFPTNGEVLPTNEKIVHDLDEKGNVIGWHKEAVSDTPATEVVSNG